MALAVSEVGRYDSFRYVTWILLEVSPCMPIRFRFKDHTGGLTWLEICLFYLLHILRIMKKIIVFKRILIGALGQVYQV
ncbi:hypothetical protein ASPTUDRAFT_488688 [Aspergillus tubingensis CBS 134.48]|uniref:Uncharacterized protein n=1 Tax=Aspergillus tubingensis (strain CBS 134.48) TaxID=767770 RepID=A0A1L9NBT3_ASPTC|nr:hypothetical protein ASPTUDRAFT_488688 [Aspergillus tubingensis CBS 134.48]